MKNTLCLLLMGTLCSVSLWAQDDSPKLINPSAYPSPEDVGVATYIVTDFPNVDPTGVTASDFGFTQALSRLRAKKGGVLYVPAGKYKLSNKLVIPLGVTVRGDWKKPEKGSPVEGTILMAYLGKGTETESNAFITMEPSTALFNLSIWYPEQTPDHIQAYPPTILYGLQGVWGNDYCNVRNVTLVNSYSGITISRLNSGGCPNIFNVYGTPLSRGIEIDNIADVGRFDWIDFSPDYWADSGLPGAPQKGSAYSQWMRKNGTALVMRRNDWSYTCHFSAEGYKTGFHALASVKANADGGYSIPNGQNYSLTFKNCQTAIHCERVAGAGMIFTRVTATGCDNGVVIGPEAAGTVQLYDCSITAQNNALVMDKSASTKLLTQQCTFNQGHVYVLGGVFTASDADFNNDAPQVYIGANGRAILTGNRFEQEAEIKNNSLFDCVIDHTPVSVRKLPEFPDIRPRITRPARIALYDVTSSEFGGKADNKADNTVAIQSALDKAAADGGGIVYLPPGKYKVLGNLVVPTGVELKGSADLATVPKGQGSILEVYAGKGDPSAAPFLKLSEGSGIRGITFDYPEQVGSLLPDMPVYPYCIQGTGKDIYVVNVGIRATYYGLDLFTYKCDNHYVDYLAGHAFKNVVRVGGGSENGQICNLQFNTIVYSSGFETKFGSWPNSIQDFKEVSNDQNLNTLEFIIVGDCKNQILYNDFHCIAHRGIKFIAENGKAASGLALGLGIDAALRSVTVEAIGDFDLINSQVVSPSNANLVETRFIETPDTFDGEITFFASDFWGGTRNGAVLEGGTIRLILPNFNTSGSAIFLNMPGDQAHFDVFNAFINNPTRFVSAQKESFVSAESVLTTPKEATVNDFAKWQNNLNIVPAFTTGVTLNRSGWIAYASNNSSKTMNALDGSASSRWDTGGSQTPGQWFYVDTRNPVTANKMIIDNSASPNDSPAEYKLYVSANGVDWGEPVASGKTSAAVAILPFPDATAQYFKIEQTGTKTNYWSIHEFYLAYTEEEAIDVTALKPVNKAPLKVYYANGALHLPEATGPSHVDLFTLAGQKVLSLQTSATAVPLGKLAPGLYILTIHNEQTSLSHKILINNF